MLRAAQERKFGSRAAAVTAKSDGCRSLNLSARHPRWERKTVRNPLRVLHNSPTASERRLQRSRHHFSARKTSASEQTGTHATFLHVAADEAVEDIGVAAAQAGEEGVLLERAGDRAQAGERTFDQKLLRADERRFRPAGKRLGRRELLGHGRRGGEGAR